MIDFSEIPHGGDIWELFARDLLKQLGFFIETTPDRGPDRGKDMLVTEQLQGNLSKYRFRWLVSCKHFAKSGKAVSEKDEPNVVERLRSFEADGFLGVYSTVASSGLNARLVDLRHGGSIKDFHIFDHREVENRLVTVGYSTLLLRYFPQSYKTIRPLHQVLDKYVPLKCRNCGKDLLQALYTEQGNYMGIIVTLYGYDKETNVSQIQDVYACCKDDCDRALRQRRNNGFRDGWNDISDLVIPLNFIRHIMALLNGLRGGHYTYTEEAFGKEKDILIALSQKVLRETSGSERKRVKNLMQLPF